MSRFVVCQTCGRRYDYDKDEICPHCGAFTSPGYTRTKLEEELLRASGHECSPGCMPQGYGGHDRHPQPDIFRDGSAGGRASQGSRNTARSKHEETAEAHTAADSPELSSPVSGRKAGRRVAVIVIVLAIFVAVFTVAIIFISLDTGIGKKTESAAQREFTEAVADVGEQFSTGQLEVRVGDSYAFGGGELDGTVPDGYVCVVVSITANELEDAEMPDTLEAPCMRYDGDMYAEPTDTYSETALADALENRGLTPVDYSDVEYWGSIDGFLIYILPEGCSDCSVCVEDYYSYRGEWYVGGVTEVALSPASGADAQEGVSL